MCVREYIYIYIYIHTFFLWAFLEGGPRVRLHYFPSSAVAVRACLRLRGEARRGKLGLSVLSVVTTYKCLHLNLEPRSTYP